MRRINGVTRLVLLLVLVAAVCTAADVSRPAAAAGPLVVVVRQGGMCTTISACRSVFRITETTISGDGYRPRPLSSASRRSLLRALGELDAGYLRRHPFR